MRGTTRFSARNGALVRGLLVELRRADREGQKTIRSTLRDRFSFYITDFDQSQRGFTRSDFDALVAQGTITLRA